VGFCDAVTGGEIRRFVVQHRFPQAMAFSPDLKIVVSSGGFDSDIRRWDTVTGK
jgi:hypothetical protein